jgi:acetylornithine/N-succinyldiaminopimelate aminotransferase
MKEYIAEAEKDLLHTYNRYQIVLDKGEGVHLYDTDGKKYLDFVAGIAVFALGYQNKAYNDALKAQIDKVIHTSNYYYNVPAIEAARKIKKVSGMDRVFFTNSGAEAVEGAIKAARKYAYLKDGCTDHEIIAMNHSFHGRTMGALSVTGNPKYREAFQPMIGHIKFAELNDFQSVLDQVTDKTCAIIMETVQGEGGLRPANEEFLKQVRDLCDERDILLILDEIQCGMGRTGYMYAWQRFGVKPDIMTSAKALGCGVPVGAFMMTRSSHAVSGYVHPLYAHHRDNPYPIPASTNSPCCIPCRDSASEVPALRTPWPSVRSPCPGCRLFCRHDPASYRRFPEYRCSLWFLFSAPFCGR